MRFVRLLAILASALLSARLIAPSWCAWDASAARRGDQDAALGRGVIAIVDEGVRADQFATGSRQIDGEWWFATYMMAVMGLGQAALAHPELHDAHAAAMDRAIDRLLEPDLRGFDRESWGSDAMDALDGDRGHVGYISYFSAALAMDRLVDPGRHDATEERFVHAMIRRFEADLMPETYPGERYPVDCSTGIAAIALHDRATGEDHSALLHRWTAKLQSDWVDDDGLLLQRFHHGEAVDVGRGSGTFLAAYFIAFADPDASRTLWEHGRDALYNPLLGFGMMREIPHGTRMDVDSGPVILGRGVSATGFALAPARIHGDGSTFAGLYATTDLFGVPVDRGDARVYATGGPLGDALIYAMLTAPDRKRWNEAPGLREARAARARACKVQDPE
jgi:hypothetical protein